MIITIRTEATDSGAHYWSNWLSCQRKAWYGEAQKLARKKKAPTERAGLLSGIAAFDIGSLVHAILAVHYTSKSPLTLDTRKFEYKLDTKVPLDRDAHSEDIEEAERLYRGYRTHWLQDDLGEVLAVEEEFAMDMNGQTVSGGLDLVVKLSKRDVKRLAPSIPGLEREGIYIVDHKARGSRADPMQYEVDLHSAQFTLYPILWEANHKGDEVQGSIVNVLHKDKGAPRFVRHLIPKLAIKSEWPIVQGMLVLGYKNRVEALKLIDSGGLPNVNTDICFKYGFKGWEACSFYKSSLCDRRQHVGRKVKEAIV